MTLLVLGCIRTETAEVDGSSTWAIADTIALRWGEYREILVRGDAPALASMFTDDAILMEPGMAAFRGRGAIERFASEMFEQFTLTKVTNRTTELTVHDDTVYEFGTYTEVGGRHEAPPDEYRGRYVVVWKRSDDGTWQIHRMMVHGLLSPESS